MTTRLRAGDATCLVPMLPTLASAMLAMWNSWRQRVGMVFDYGMTG